MSGPSVVVDRAPDGWTHIGGPGMHLLIGLDEDDERTLAASDAADGGDLDDVVEVLTAGGIRRAQHFVGVHWQPRTRIVAFGPVAAVVTLADGSEHDVRATSAKVWTDLELSEHPEKVVLRVLDESERAAAIPPQTLTPDGPVVSGRAATAPAPQPDAESRPEPATAPEPATVPEPVTAPEPPVATAGPASTGIPTFGASAEPSGAGASGRPAGSSWGRSWARAEHAAPTRADEHPSASEGPGSTDSGHPAPQADPEPQALAPVVSGTAAVPTVGTAADPEGPDSSGSPHPQGDSVAPAVSAPFRQAPATTETTVAQADSLSEASHPAPPLPSPRVVEPAAPVAADLPPATPRDVDSTWAARPVLEPERAELHTPAPAAPASAPHVAGAPAPDPGDEQPAAPPSYDYLFGHTTMADEHRRVLAQLNAPDDEEVQDDEDEPAVPVVPPVDPILADAPDASVTNAAPAPDVPARPIPEAPQLPEGGLISSVPWATSTPAPVAPKAETAPDVPTFSGRHTPPPAPSLLPPMNTPPPGARAPEATPLISSGPPPVSPRPAASPPPVGPPRVPPHPPAPASAASPGEPSFDVPVSAPLGPTPAPASPPQTAAPGTPFRAVTQPLPTVPASTIGAGTDDDDAELTVDRSALLEARNAAQNQAFSGPSVLAVLCSAGHPTPPHSDRCRVCGAGIPPQEPFTMPRPPLGVLRLSTGDVVTLDRSVLLGRAPKLGEGLAAHDRPHVVKVPSPERDVSRNHVEVILEGWHVLIRDLGTTNGTTVMLPGEVPVRLRANDQQVLEPGSLVSMADEVSFTFEAAS